MKIKRDRSNLHAMLHISVRQYTRKGNTRGEGEHGSYTTMAAIAAAFWKDTAKHGVDVPQAIIDTRVCMPGQRVKFQNLMSTRAPSVAALVKVQKSSPTLGTIV